jgi:hypothetical protein
VGTEETDEKAAGCTMSSNKRWTLAKREEELRRALISNANDKAIVRAAEHVREARLAVLKKIESAEVPAQSGSAARTKTRTNLQRERKWLLEATIAEIVSEVRRRKTR